MAEEAKRANKLKSTRYGGELVNQFWEGVFSAHDEGKLVCAYDGTSINPMVQAMDMAWMHGEAISALLAGRHQEKPPQAASEQRGYNRELCSYARTHIGCALFTERGMMPEGMDPRSIARRVPRPDMIVSAYAACSTGQQWDEYVWRLFGRNLPRYNVNIPFLWDGKGSGYLSGPDYKAAVKYTVEQLRGFATFLEEVSGRPYNWDKLSEIISYIKQAGQLRMDAINLCRAKPAPASFFDWVVSIAPVNFIKAGPEIVKYFEGVKAEIEGRLARGESAVPNEKYRLYWHGIMNWNKIGWLADKFAAMDACLIAGAYTHSVFWAQPETIDPENPLEAIAVNALACPNNLATSILADLTTQTCRDFSLDGIVLHASRTCRAWTTQQLVVADRVTRSLGIPSAMFEGDVTDESFYQDAIVSSRVEAMLEAIEARRRRVS